MVALCGVSQNWENKSFSRFAVFAVSANLHKTLAALCVTMRPKVGQNVSFSMFVVFAVFSKSQRNKRGAMWCYPKIWTNKVFARFCRFQQISKKHAWRYVALYGAIPKFEKTRFFSAFAVFSKSPKKQAWRYVALSQNLEKTRLFSIFAFFAVFSESKKKTVVALSTISKKYQRLNWSQCCFCCFQHMSQK